MALARKVYAPASTLWEDILVLKSMFFASIDTTGDHQNTLESFYKSQAGLYDKYRHRMLHGRTPMIMGMDAPKNGVWVDLGCGTVRVTFS